MTQNIFRRIRVSGTAAERSRQYGEFAKPQIERGRTGYEENFRKSGISWDQATEHALRYAPAIHDAYPEIYTEIEGIAEGSGLSFADILTMNCRTEIMWEQANRNTAAAHIRGECSSFGLTTDRTEHGRALIGQNWDWLVHAIDSVIVLEVEREDGPNYVTIVEAGLLAKTSLNQHGLAVGVNTLITEGDFQTEGIPFHVLLRALVDDATVFDAVETLASVRRASSGNFLLGSADGAVLNIECEPGGAGGVHPVSPRGGQVVHTNHFVSPVRTPDLAPVQMPDSYVRLQRMHDLLQSSEVHTNDTIHAALVDHVGSPGSICCHPDSRSDESKQWASIASIIIDPKTRELFLCEGLPCETPRVLKSYAELLSA